MVRGGGKPGKGKEDLDKAEADTEQGRGGHENTGNVFKAVVQQVLLFGEETWVLIPIIERALDLFMHGDARRITGRQTRIGGTGNDITPPWRGP